MTERKKIIDVLRGSIEYEVNTYPDDNYTEVVIKYGALADALIAAGIGDVGETKEKLKKINERILLGDIIACDLSAKCAEYKYRAEVAEREAIILSKWLADKTRKDYPYQAWLEAAQKQAEKELAKEGK